MLAWAVVVVASNTRGPRFKSSHWQLLMNIYLLLTVCRKYENKEKEAGNGRFLKTNVSIKRCFFRMHTCYLGGGEGEEF